MHVHSQRIEIYDFKSDVVADGDALLERYGSQMEAYRSAAAEIFGLEKSKVVCCLISTYLGELIEPKTTIQQGEVEG